MSEQVKESSTKPGNRSVAAFLTRLTQVCTTKLGKTIGAILLFLVILFTVRALQTRFDIVALWEDDLRCYESFLSWDFWTFVFPNSRPASAFYLWVGFAIFGANVTGLVWYWAFWFSAVILSAFFLFYEVSKRKTLSLLLAAVLLFSRLNWYYYIVHMGVMESITLLHAIWAAFFAIRFIRTKRWYWALIAFAVAIMATFSHERFLGLPPIITVLAVIYLQKWPRKVIGGGIGVLGSFSLFFFKTVILHQPFWVSGGAIETTFDIRILITHFFQIFVNCFALWGDAHWIGGMSNALLSGEGIGLMVFSIIGFSLLFLIALWGFVRIITTKNWAKFAIALLLTGIYLVLAMGGSITQKDVETRWIFPPLLFLLSFIAVTMTEWKLPTMKKEARQITFLWDSRLYLTSCTILMCVSSLCFNTYISNNRYRFYIDDWNASARLFKELLIDGYHTSGKEGVAVYTMTKHMEGARGILDQYGIKDYRVFTEQDPFPAVAPFADPYSVVINDTMVTPLLPTYQFDLWQTWVGHDFNFYTFASEDYFPLIVDWVENPFGKPNGLTIRVNGLVVGYYLVSQKATITVPLVKGTVNHISLDADFTWNPKAMGIGDDTRDLGVYVPHMGTHDTKGIDPNDSQWVGEEWAQSFYSSTGQKLKINFTSPIHNGASLYINGEYKQHVDFSVSHSVEIPMSSSQGTLVRLVPDKIIPVSQTECDENYQNVGFQVRLEAI